MQEVDQLAGDMAPAYDSLADDLGGLLTPEDLNCLADPVPSGVSVVVMLFEHLWAHALRSAIDRAGGQVLGGGMAEPEALQRLESELTTQASVP